MEELMAKIDNALNNFIEDANEYHTKGNKSAARRARKTTLELEKLFKQFRKDSVG